MTGIVMATADEARPLLVDGRAELVDAEPFPVYRLDESVLLVVSGMGADLARRACRELIRKHSVRTVINAGVCGALVDGIVRGRVFGICSVADATRPDRLSLPGGPTPGLDRRTLVTVDSPVFDAERRKFLARTGELVDMEGFAVVDECGKQGVPCCLIKGVTDFGDANGRQDIRNHIAAVSRHVADEARRIAVRMGSGTDALLPRLLRFTRVEHTVFSLPLLFAGAWLGAGGRCPSLRSVALIALAGTGARTFGMSLNRILDRGIDARNPRTAHRELPTGRLSLGQGYAVAAAGLAAYLLACALLGPTVLRLSLVPVVPLALYSFLKRFTCLCHFGIGLCLALAPLGAYVAVTDGLAFSPRVLLLAWFTFGWMSGFDIIYALLDTDFDRAHGVRSLPAAMGPARAQYMAGITHLISAAALVTLWYDSGGWTSGAALLVAIAAFAGAYWPRWPVAFRFFPMSAIAGIAGALVVLTERLP